MPKRKGVVFNINLRTLFRLDREKSDFNAQHELYIDACYKFLAGKINKFEYGNALEKYQFAKATFDQAWDREYGII